MVVTGADLVGDLKAVRKGRGLAVVQLGERLGPSLRHVCGVADGDNSTVVRTKVADHLRRLAEQLPEDLRLAVTAGLGIHPEARQPFYQERVRWVGERLHRDERTARRRVDEGIEALAALAAGLASAAPTPGSPVIDWHTAELRVLMSVDLASPEAFEYRRIVADRDDLHELDLALTLTASRHERSTPYRELEVDVFRGGTLVGRPREARDRFAFGLTLPRRLMRGDEHEYVLRFRVPPGQPMQPHYVCVPKHRCDRFDLHVRFGAEQLPRRAWRLHEAFQRDVDDPDPCGDPLPLDPAGELHVTFERLKPGLAYGVRWEDTYGLGVDGPARRAAATLPLRTPADDPPGAGGPELRDVADG